MLSVVVTILSLAVMLFMIASFIISASYARRRQMHISATQAQISASPSEQSTSMTAYLHDGLVITVPQQTPQPIFHLPPHWYTRWRTLISLGFLLMVLLTLFVQSGLADGTLQNLSRSFGLLNAYSQSSDIHTSAHISQVNASHQLVRISQLDPNQYSSSAEYSTWAYSACSAAAMTEVFNAYGRHFRVTDVLKVEAHIGEITPDLGLLRPQGIQSTAAQFGFQTTWGNAWTLDSVIAVANQGKPVIVSFPPDRYTGGHILVVTGGNSDFVYLADTSLWNRRSVTRSQFLQWWEGYAAIVTPR